MTTSQDPNPWERDVPVSDGFKNRLGPADKKVSKLQDTSKEDIQNEAYSEKKRQVRSHRHEV